MKLMDILIMKKRIYVPTQNLTYILWVSMLAIWTLQRQRLIKVEVCEQQREKKWRKLGELSDHSADLSQVREGQKEGQLGETIFDCGMVLRGHIRRLGVLQPKLPIRRIPRLLETDMLWSPCLATSLTRSSLSCVCTL